MKLKENGRKVLTVILLAALLGGSLYINLRRKDQTPPEVLEMAEQIKTLKLGDFLIQNDEAVLVVAIGVHQNGGHHLLVKPSLGGLGNNASPLYLARITHHIVRQDDPGWELVAKKFLCGSSGIAQVDSSN